MVPVVALAGEVLLPAVNLWRELLPLHGRRQKMPFFSAKKTYAMRFFCAGKRRVFLTGNLSRGFAANLPPGPEAGEHAAGRQPGASPQDLRLRLLQGVLVLVLLVSFQKRTSSFRCLLRYLKKCFSA